MEYKYIILTDANWKLINNKTIQGKKWKGQ